MESSPRKKCYVVVQRGFAMGGIETLILRITKSIVNNGDQLVVCGEQGSMSTLLPDDIDFFPVMRDRDLLSRLPKYIKDKYAASEIVLISMHPWSLVACYILRYQLGLFRENWVRTFHLVTHSRAFFFNTNFPIVNKFLRKIFLSAPRSSVFFMNDAARTAHADEWKIDLSGYDVLRLPLAVIQPTWKPEKNSCLRVVSVGRLVPFKAYNRAAPSIVKLLLDKGIPVTWDIWGDGEDQGIVKEEIRVNNVTEEVVLRGELPYSEFADTVSSYDVFIGMGTALLEAAQSGVPSVCAIDDDSHHSYGFLYEAPTDSVGDIVAGVDRISIVDMLLRFHMASPVEQQEIGRLCANSARDRSHDLEQFVTLIRKSPKWPIRLNFTSQVLLVASWIFFSLRDIRTLRANHAQGIE